MEKTCLHCARRIVGKSDKKFCDHGCRYGYHNQLNSERNNASRRILYAARKNHRILQQLADSGKTTYSRDELLASGFDFNAITGTETIRGIREILKVFELMLMATGKGYRIRKAA